MEDRRLRRCPGEVRSVCAWFFLSDSLPSLAWFMWAVHRGFHGPLWPRYCVRFPSFEEWFLHTFPFIPTGERSFLQVDYKGSLKVGSTRHCPYTHLTFPLLRIWAGTLHFKCSNNCPAWPSSPLHNALPGGNVNPEFISKKWNIILQILRAGLKLHSKHRIRGYERTF